MSACMGLCPCPQCRSSRVDVSGLGPDEVRVLQRIADRLRLGAKAYGRLDIKNDGRDWQDEATAEFLDGCVYLAIKSLKGRP